MLIMVLVFGWVVLSLLVAMFLLDLFAPRYAESAAVRGGVVGAMCPITAMSFNAMRQRFERSNT